MERLKIAFSFIKIKLNKIGNILLKATTGYAVGSFALIQVSSIVSDNISMAEAFGLTKESFMQYLFVSLIIIFPIFLIVTYILRSKSVDKEIMSTLDNNLSKIEDYRPKIAVIPFENLNQDKDQQFLVDGIAEDLLMELSMVKELSVATRKTCFDFKNKDYTSKEFKDEYGFDYIVTGSIRASDNKLRILIELSDMTDDRVIWTNKFDHLVRQI